MKRLLTRLRRPDSGDAAPASGATGEDTRAGSDAEHTARVVSIEAGDGPESAYEPATGQRAATAADAPVVTASPDPALAPLAQAPAQPAAPQAPDAAAEDERLAATALPAGLDPADLEERPTTRRRSAVRRRLRFLRRAREMLLRDLGGIVYEVARSNTSADELVRRKIDRLTGMDAEIAALSAALGERERTLVVREPGIGGVCAVCDEVFGSAARFCSSCGADVTSQTPAVEAALTAPAPAAEAAPAAVTAPAGSASTRIASWTSLAVPAAAPPDAGVTADPGAADPASAADDPAAPYRRPAAVEPPTSDAPSSDLPGEHAVVAPAPEESPPAATVAPLDDAAARQASSDDTPAPVADPAPAPPDAGRDQRPAAPDTEVMPAARSTPPADGPTPATGDGPEVGANDDLGAGTEDGAEAAARDGREPATSSSSAEAAATEGAASRDEAPTQQLGAVERRR